MPEAQGVDEVHIDKTGRFVFINTTQQGPPDSIIEGNVRDLASGSLTALTDGSPDFNATHYDLGTGITIGSDNWNNRVTRRELSDPHAFQEVFSLGNDWTIAVHFSLLAEDEAWFLASFYAGDPPGVFRGEIVQIASDGSGNVRRLAHHRSIFSDYYDSPRANSSYDGCYVAFTSNWGGSGRRDVFLLNLSR